MSDARMLQGAADELHRAHLRETELRARLSAAEQERNAARNAMHSMAGRLDTARQERDANLAEVKRLQGVWNTQSALKQLGDDRAAAEARAEAAGREIVALTAMLHDEGYSQTDIDHDVKCRVAALAGREAPPLTASVGCPICGSYSHLPADCPEAL